MKAKRCCNAHKPWDIIAYSDGTFAFDDACCNLFEDVKYCPFCGAKLELEK